MTNSDTNTEYLDYVNNFDANKVSLKGIGSFNTSNSYINSSDDSDVLFNDCTSPEEKKSIIKSLKIMLNN